MYPKHHEAALQPEKMKQLVLINLILCKKRESKLHHVREEPFCCFQASYFYNQSLVPETASHQEGPFHRQACPLRFFSLDTPASSHRLIGDGKW